METSKFTVICHGKKRETLTAGAVMTLFPKLEPLRKIQGAMDHLLGEVSASRKNQFHLVNLIDTPGLVDGDRYNYDIDSAIDAVAAMADLIFVFFDPQGQALCQRTVGHVERLCMSHPQKLSLWLTKCDLVKDEGDRMKVLQQISAELARRPVIARQGLYLKAIFVPGLSNFQPDSLNQLNSVLRLIEKAITAHFQDNVLMKLLSHCKFLDRTIGERRDAVLSKRETRRVLAGSCTLIPAVLMIVCIAFVSFFLAGRDTVKGCGITSGKTDRILQLWDIIHSLPSQYDMPILSLGFWLIAIFGMFAARSPLPSSAFEKEVKEALRKLRDASGCIDDIRKEAKKLYDEFLLATVDDL